MFDPFGGILCWRVGSGQHYCLPLNADPLDGERDVAGARWPEYDRGFLHSPETQEK